MALSYYKVSSASVVLVEIDPINHVHSFGGIDALEVIRAAMILS